MGTRKCSIQYFLLKFDRDFETFSKYWIQAFSIFSVLVFSLNPNIQNFAFFVGTDTVWASLYQTFASALSVAKILLFCTSVALTQPQQRKQTLFSVWNNTTVPHLGPDQTRELKAWRGNCPWTRFSVILLARSTEGHTFSMNAGHDTLLLLNTSLPNYIKVGPALSLTLFFWIFRSFCQRQFHVSHVQKLCRYERRIGK